MFLQCRIAQAGAEISASLTEKIYQASAPAWLQGFRAASVFYRGLVSQNTSAF